jgi:hypothetical protein
LFELTTWFAFKWPVFNCQSVKLLIMSSWFSSCYSLSVYTFAADAVDDCGCWVGGVSLCSVEEFARSWEKRAADQASGSLSKGGFPYWVPSTWEVWLQMLQNCNFRCFKFAISDASNLQFSFVRLALCGR